ncbi:MAG: Uma2 family endonuclease [Nitrospirae bacterium]|nr:Uma2 family endonuclease [Nitrospirota bacterium]
MTSQAISKKSPSVKFTYEDYLLFTDDGKRHELIDGEHYMTPSPNEKHQRVSMNLSHLLSHYVKKNPKGRIYHAPFDVVLSDQDVVQPDLLFVSAARASLITEKCIQGAPDLVIEILSESTRKTDEIIKRKLYARHGVGEYWIVDPELETVKVYRRAASGDYVRAAELSRETGDTIATPLLPGLAIPLAEIFA